MNKRYKDSYGTRHHHGLNFLIKEVNRQAFRVPEHLEVISKFSSICGEETDYLTQILKGFCDPATSPS